MISAAAAPRIRLQNLLFATDFSPCSETVLPYVLAIARRYSSNIHILHLVQAAHPKEDKHLAEEFVRKIASSERINVAKHEELVVEGEMSSVLNAIVREHEIDLIALGAHGERVTSATLGSVAETAFRTAECPLLTMGSTTSVKPEGNPESVLFPTDFRPESLAALRYATFLAQAYEARLVLLYVAPELDFPINGARLGGLMEVERPVSPPDAQAVVASLRQRLRQLVPEIEPACLVEFGSPAEAILRVANEQDIELMVLGVQRPKPLLPLLRLGTAYKLMCAARCPVLTVSATCRP